MKFYITCKLPFLTVQCGSARHHRIRWRRRKSMAAQLYCNFQNVKCFFLSTAVSQSRIRCISPLCRSLSTKDEHKAKRSNSKYKDTVLLPKTNFPLWLDPRHRAKHDADILTVQEIFDSNHDDTHSGL